MIKEDRSLLKKIGIFLLIGCIIASLLSLGLYLTNKKFQKSPEYVGEEWDNINNITNYILFSAEIIIPLGFLAGIISLILGYYYKKKLTIESKEEVKE